MPPSTPAEFETRLSVAAARRYVIELCAARRLPSESVALESALGRVLAEDVIAPHDQPPFANSAMDGFALRGEDLPGAGEHRFRLVGQVLAGAASAPACGPGECVRITTGAPLPPGADSVVVKENVHVDGDTVVVAAGEAAFANVRPAGEDYRAGDVALRAGGRLTPARLGVLASLGRVHATVARQPRVALFVTGDELVPPSQPLGFGQIHDSNRYSLGALLRQLGIEPQPIAHLRDDPVALRDALRDAGERCDLVISSGGVSAGEADFLPGLVADLGKVHFWKVRMKPGMPALCGEIGGALVFALPGNPVSTIATFLALVRPALAALQGATDDAAPVWRARLAAPLTKRHDRAEFLRATLQSREDGALWAMPLAKQGSGMLRGVAEANALIFVPEETRELAAGAVVEAWPLPGLC
ncbi:gephyrin-like molybdotransferase Glp [Dokdonella sp.]|uniref:molybdopterin molybdotransferase MoeA n=1 Tax=Dokdonella sp. TaxID=2291710 RepID=UPI001B052E31|nr:gephyrin-like molybdotransferase Glp [Dokdonella sp.]MBO9664534.1 molybdopterin molybdotransferase MoeA [Dokdonella sp.]